MSLRKGYFSSGLLPEGWTGVDREQGISVNIGKSTTEDLMQLKELHQRIDVLEKSNKELNELVLYMKEVFDEEFKKRG